MAIAREHWLALLAVVGPILSKNTLRHLLAGPWLKEDHKTLGDAAWPRNLNSIHAGANVRFACSMQQRCRRGCFPVVFRERSGE
jgi:hypothetical protein